MPTKPLDELTTIEIVNLIRDNSQDYTLEDMCDELLYREIPSNDVSVSNTEYRGGIRPTHAPSH